MQFYSTRCKSKSPRRLNLSESQFQSIYSHKWHANTLIRSTWYLIIATRLWWMLFCLLVVNACVREADNYAICVRMQFFFQITYLYRTSFAKIFRYLIVALYAMRLSLLVVYTLTFDDKSAAWQVVILTKRNLWIGSCNIDEFPPFAH